MNRRQIPVLMLTILLMPMLATPVPAAAPQVSTQAANSQPKPNDAVVHDFVFDDGENLASLKLHYLTLGKPRRDASGAITNGVLLLHGTAGSSADLVTACFFDALYGAGEPLDLSHYFLVIPDVIGAGDSSKPSDGLRAHFPRYGYKDQVRAQHLLLEQIGIKHLRLVFGTSMGGMQTWMWGERYPEMMDALLPIASLPERVVGRNLLWRRLLIKIIEFGDDARRGASTPQPPSLGLAWNLLELMAGSPARVPTGNQIRTYW